MHRVVSGAKVLQQVGVSHFAVTCRKTHTASSQSLLLALCAHRLLSRAGMPQTCHSDTCWPLLCVGSSFGGMREKTPGGRLLGRVTILPAVLDGCWQANKESSARSRRVWEPCCQQEAGREQQGHCVLWKISLSSIFPLIPCLEQSQSHREGTGMGAAITDSNSQHVSKRVGLEESTSVPTVLLAQPAQNLGGAAHSSAP